MNGGKIVDTNLICKLPVQTSRDIEPFDPMWYIKHHVTRYHVISFTSSIQFSVVLLR